MWRMKRGELSPRTSHEGGSSVTAEGPRGRTGTWAGLMGVNPVGQGAVSRGPADGCLWPRGREFWKPLDRLDPGRRVPGRRGFRWEAEGPLLLGFAAAGGRSGCGSPGGVWRDAAGRGSGRSRLLALGWGATPVRVPHVPSTGPGAQRPLSTPRGSRPMGPWEVPCASSPPRSDVVSPGAPALLPRQWPAVSRAGVSSELHLLRPEQTRAGVAFGRPRLLLPRARCLLPAPASCELQRCPWPRRRRGGAQPSAELSSGPGGGPCSFALQSARLHRAFPLSSRPNASSVA